MFSYYLYVQVIYDLNLQQISNFFNLNWYTLFQDWFTECARVISQSCGQSVEWITPLGLPVVQPYNRRNKYHDHTKKSSVKMGEHFILDMYE